MDESRLGERKEERRKEVERRGGCSISGEGKRTESGLPKHCRTRIELLNGPNLYLTRGVREND